MTHHFDIYSEQILAYHLSGQAEEKLKDISAAPGDTAEKHLRYAERRAAQSIILFGAGDGKLGYALAQKKSAKQELIICDLFPEHIRKMNTDEINIFPKNIILLTDSSVWAHLLLLMQNGYFATNSHLILNPGLDGKSKKKHQYLQKLLSGTKQIQPPQQVKSCKISAAAILSPDEPELENFINNFPDWIDEIVLVWDCNKSDTVPELNNFQATKIINVYHPLDADFSAQRNRMLRNCSGEWIIYLDADERLSPASWEKIRQMTSYNECEGWYLPRMTFYPDHEHCRIGYGLWPDLQLRLFRNNPNLKFVNRIHEQLTGLNGASGILSSSPIEHLTHLLKSREKIESKLENFNRSTGKNFKHQLGNDFPNISNDLLPPHKDSKIEALLLPTINTS